MRERKFFLDWLRVLAFGTLVLFHLGMLYVSWPYNLKSPRLFPHLEWLMEATSPWRMPLLFVISGVACRFLIVKLGPGRFFTNRLTRLGAVIVTGMLLVNPLQVWVQLVAQGDTTLSYLKFWFTAYLVSDSSYFSALGRPMPSWDHLWFLVYLLLYCGIAALTFALFGMKSKRARVQIWLFVVVPAAWMAMANVLMATLAPFTHALFNDWAAHLKWLGLFATGLVLAGHDDVWATLQNHRRALALSALALLAVYLSCRLPSFDVDENVSRCLAYRVTEGMFGWTTVLAIIGFAARHLDQPSAALRYLNDGVLPIYVLHQPVLLMCAHLIFPQQLPVGLEMVFLMIATAAIPLAIYHFAIRPWPLIRAMFGLRFHPEKEASAAGPGH